MNLTLLILGGVTGILIAYDSWVIVVRGYNATISNTMLQTAKRYPIVPFGLGVVVGHLFWQGGCWVP